MSNQWASTYDWPATVTPSDSVDDPNGPFSGLLIQVPGTLWVYPYAGPHQASGLGISVQAGEYLRFPVKRVGITGTSGASAIGLVAPIVRQGK